MTNTAVISRQPGLLGTAAVAKYCYLCLASCGKVAKKDRYPEHTQDTGSSEVCGTAL